MEFCTIDFKIDDQRATLVQLVSTRTLLDFDVVIFDPSRSSHADQGHCKRRRSEIQELLGLGRVVVWFIRSGPIHHLLPIPPTAGVAFSGTKVEFVGRDIYRDFWKSIDGWLEYEAYLEGALGEPFLKVLNSQKPIGSTIETNSGLIILLPAPRATNTASNYNALWSGVLDALSPFLHRLRPSKGSFAFPKWSFLYTWQTEKKIRSTLSKLQETAAETAQAIASTSATLAQEEQLRHLFASSGDALVDAVIDALNELGAKAQRGEAGRADVVIEFDGLHAVIEVKGRKGSAAEKDAAQLEKWVAMFKEERDVDAKGILVINAFCDAPLAKRTEDAFPNQMLKYSKQREHCLMTATQLLGMVLASRGKPDSGKAFLKRIFSTVGICHELLDHSSFIVTNPAEQELTQRN